MTSVLSKALMRLVVLFLAFFLAVGTFALARQQGWLSPLGINSESRDSRVITAIERTQQVSLVSLGIQGIDEERRSRELFGKDIPGTGEALFLKYEFKAKLGLDGAKVKVARTGDNAYRISVPRFTFIGYDDLQFDVAVEDDGVLSFVTPDIEELDVVTEILDDDAKQEYVASNEDLLKEQTMTFYDSLIKSVSPNSSTSYDFRSQDDDPA